MILNLISSIKLNKRLQSPRIDIEEVLNNLASLFTSLVHTIVREIKDQDVHKLRAEAEFLFGGWSWLENRFRIWRLYYSKDAEGFVFKEYTDDPSKTRVYAFLGNPETLARNAAEQYKKEVFNNDSQDEKLDMEPLRVLIDMSRDTGIREVDGPIQIAKVYKSGTSELFGMYWQEKPHFQARTFAKHNKPDVRYFDPETLTLSEDQLPTVIEDLTHFSQLEDFEFICSCYGEDGGLKEDLSDNDRERLISVFHEAAYQSFIDTMKSAGSSAP